MGRILALDIGSVRIGVAVSDPFGAFAQPIAVLDAKGEWKAELASLLKQYSVFKVVVGLPVRTTGQEGLEAETVRKVRDELASCFPDVSFVFWDERFTTTIAQQALLEGDLSRKNRRKRIDKVAASILLQSYLDHEGSI